MKTIVFFALLSINLAQTNFATQSNYLGADIYTVKNQITICVNPQVELISIIQTISEYHSIFGFLMSKDTSAYKREVFQYFMPFSGHPVVKMFENLSSKPRMLNFSAPSNIMFYTDNHLQIRDDIELDGFVTDRIGGMDSLKVFLELLRDFASKSSFNRFYREHQNYYSEIVKQTESNLGNTLFINEIENFYGESQKSYNIVLVSLYSQVGYGNSVTRPDKKLEIFNTMGPQKFENDLPCFGDEAYLKYLIRHEFSHPFVNRLTNKHWDMVKGYSQKYNFIPKTAREKVCGDWQECINEFVIRAITTHWAYNESEETGLMAEKYEITKGMPDSYMKNLLQIIENYESNRIAYPTFDSCFSEILKVFVVN